MEKIEIYFLFIIIIVISIYIFFLIKGLKKGGIYLRGGILIKKEETPVLFWLALSLEIAIILFLLAVITFFVIYYFP